MSQSSGEQASSPQPAPGTQQATPAAASAATPSPGSQPTPAASSRAAGHAGVPGPPHDRRTAFGWPSSGWTGGSTANTDAVVRGRSRLPMKVIVGILSALLLVAVAAHLGPAVRAGLRDGTHGSWVATSKTCERNACTWDGKFVLPNGHVLVSSAQYSGKVPASIHSGTSVPGLYTGGSLVFPPNGSDQWISLLVAIGFALVGLWWSCRKLVVDYFRRRRDAVSSETVSTRRIG